MFKKITKVMMTTALAGMMLVSNVVTAQAAPMEVGVQDLFDAELYAEQNPDVKAAFGNDYQALFNHFMQYGMKEGRTFTKMFDLELYKKLYPDLVAVFGDNWAMYLTHYLTYGINEKRDGGGEFDIVAYIENNPDVVEVLGWNFSAIKNHYETFGKAEGRVAKSPVLQAIEKAAEAAKKATTTVTTSDNKEEEKSGYDTSAPVVELHKYLKEGDSYYDYTLWQAAMDEWWDAEPKFEDYYDSDAFDADYEEWSANAPSKDDYIFAYENEEAAQAAYESAHTAWEAAAPERENFIDSDAYAEAYEAYVAENPEPVVEDYPFFEDGYSDEEAATLAYEAAHTAWVNTAPVQSDFVDEDAYNEAVETYESAEPQSGDYVYHENTYASTEEASQAYTEAHTAWETAKAEALDGLTEGEEDYNTALEAFLAENEEPQESSYVYYENTYASAEEASQAYEAAHAEWEAAAPSEDDYVDEDAYNEAFSQYSDTEPTEDTFQAKVNEYESQEAATNAFNTAHTEWEESAPVEEDFIDEEAYQSAMDQYADMEPQEDQYVTVEDMGEGFVNTYDSQEAADTAYEEAYEEWIDEAPCMDDYADGFEEAQVEWEEEQPTLDEFEVEESEIPEGAEIMEALG